MSRAFNSIQQENQQQQQISQQLNYGHQHLQHKYTNIQIVLLIISHQNESFFESPCLWIVRFRRVVVVLVVIIVLDES